MIDRLVDFALRQRAAVIVLALALVVFGVDAFRRLPFEAYPDVADTLVQIVTQWPGHASEEVERQVSVPVERVMNGVPRRTSVRSVSIPGLSVVTLLFEEGTDSYFARQQVDERLAKIELPPGVVPTLGPLASPVGEILRYRLVNCKTTATPECGPEDADVAPRPLDELKDLEEYVVERELLAASGVADIVSFGGIIRQYQVLVDPALLLAHEVTFDEVESALAAANGNAGGGVIAFGRAALNVRGIGLLRPDQIGDVAVASRDGTPILVKHVAKVHVGHQPRLGRVSVDDERDVVSAIVLLRKGEHAEEVLARVHDRIDDVNRRVLPRGVKISPYYDRADLMHRTTRTVLTNLAEGLLLVAVVALVFLGNARAAFIAAVTIPLSLLFAFVCMHVAKIPANLLSIGAIDFGMLVDGAICMVEVIFLHVAEGQARGERVDVRAVARSASREVARPVAFAILVIVVAYLPIFTLQRVEGRLFRPMAWTVAFALAGALLLALTLVPVLTTLLFGDKPLRERRNPILAAARRVYRPILSRALARPRVVLVTAAAILVADVAIAASIGREFLPRLDEGAVWLRASMPANVSMAEAEAIVDGVHAGERHKRGIRDVLAGYPEITTTAVQIGRPDDGTDPTGFYNAELLLVLADRATWRPRFGGAKDRLLQAIGDDLAPIPGVTFGFSQPISDNVEEAITGVKGQLAVKVVGDDLNALEDLAEQIARAVGEVPGVVDLGIFRALGQSNVHVEIARERAERFGLTTLQVEDVVEKGIGGYPVSQIVEGERRHDLVVRYAERARDDVDAIRRLLVPLPGGGAVPLAQIADVHVVGGASRIYREGNRRYIAVKFGIRDRDLGSVVDEAQAKVAAAVRVPDGYAVTWGGEFESARRATARLAIVIPATLAGIFVLLFIVFRRPREALVVLLTVIVTSPIGGLCALVATGTSFSVSAGVGFLALFGVSVQTGVILVSCIDGVRRAPHASVRSLDDAIQHAADRRLRPIMMTGLVATLGLVPAALSTDIGSDSQRPLAIVIVGGLSSSLLLSLVVLPVLYKVLGPRGVGGSEDTGGASEVVS